MWSLGVAKSLIDLEEIEGLGRIPGLEGVKDWKGEGSEIKNKWMYNMYFVFKNFVRNLKHFTIASSTAITVCVFVYTGHKFRNKFYIFMNNFFIFYEKI